MGGKAPYGYSLEYSGEISKHGRALKHLVIISEQAEVVVFIYDLAFYKEYGSVKIAKNFKYSRKNIRIWHRMISGKLEQLRAF